MTNVEIILQNSIFLMEQGLLKPTAQKIKYKNEEGKECETFVPEPIHTFQTWKALGYSVKKGEHAVAKFPIWKPVSKKGKKQEEDGEEQKQNSYMIMKTAFFFTAEQVEKLAK